MRFHRHFRTLRTIGALALAAGIATAFAGCGGGGGSDPVASTDPTPGPAPAPTAGPAYLFNQLVYTGDAGENVVAILESPQDLKTFDRAHAALVIPEEFPSIMTDNGYVFITIGDRETITRYEVSADRKLINPTILSYANQGASGAGQTYFINATRAYTLFPDQRFLLVWNPATMELNEKVALDLADRGENGKLSVGVPTTPYPALREFAKTSGYVSLPVSWVSWADLQTSKDLGLFTISTTDPKDQRLTTSPCSTYARHSATGRDGKLYIAGSPFMLFQHGDAPSSGFARVDFSTRSYEEGFCVDSRSLANGDQIDAMLGYAPGKFLMSTYDAAVAATTTPEDYNLKMGNACNHWAGDIDEAGNITVRSLAGMVGLDDTCLVWGVSSVDGDAYIPTSVYKDDSFDLSTATHSIGHWNGTTLERIPTLGLFDTFERIR